MTCSIYCCTVPLLQLLHSCVPDGAQNNNNSSSRCSSTKLTRHVLRPSLHPASPGHSARLRRQAARPPRRQRPPKPCLPGRPLPRAPRRRRGPSGTDAESRVRRRGRGVDCRTSRQEIGSAPGVFSLPLCLGAYGRGVGECDSGTLATAVAPATAVAASASCCPTGNVWAVVVVVVDVVVVIVAAASRGGPSSPRISRGPVAISFPFRFRFYVRVYMYIQAAVRVLARRCPRFVTKFKYPYDIKLILKA